MTSEELYKLCLANDEGAWTYAYNYVVSYLRNAVGPDQDIRDMAHDTLLYFMTRGLKLIKNPMAFKKWLRLKAMSFFIDRERNERRHQHEALEIEDKDGLFMSQNPRVKTVEADPETGLFLEKAIKIIDECLKAIGEECEKLLKKYYRGRVLGHKVKDLAKEMGRPENTVRVMIHRCHKKLVKQRSYRALLEEYRE